MKGTNKYNIILSVFYIPYVLGAPFLAVLGKKYGVSRVLPMMMFTFGTCPIKQVPSEHTYANRCNLQAQ